MAAISPGSTKGNEQEAFQSLESAGIKDPSSGLVRYVAHGDMGLSSGDSARLAAIGSAPVGSAGSDVDFGFSIILEEFKKRQEERNRLVTEFDETNPFVFDEVLAEKRLQAAEQLDPFYTQTLNDYLQGVSTQRKRGLTDEKRLISELNQDVSTLQRDLKNDFQLNLQKVRQGASGAGLLTSGAGQRATGIEERRGAIESEKLLTGAQRGRKDIQRTTARSLEDLQRQQNLTTRDLETERKAQTNVLGSQLTQEAGQRRGFELRQVLGPFDEANDFDILKGLV